MKNDLRKSMRKEKKMRQKSVETYKNLVQYYNRNVSVQVECECGKILLKNRMEDHLKSGVHKLLMSYKAQCQKLQEEPALGSEPKKKYKSQWDKFVRAPVAATRSV